MRILLIFAALFLVGCVQTQQYSIPTPFVTPSPVGNVSSQSAHAPSAYPKWAYEARLAGFSFYPDWTDEEIEEKINAAVSQNVSVMLVDTPIGWDYKAWEDDVEFEKNKQLVQRVANKAHEKGMRVALYLTGLEVTGPAIVNPFEDHQDWLQLDKEGNPIQFNDISSKQEHWLEKGEVDAWFSPESSYRAFFKQRTGALAPLVDALWIDTVYLQNSIGAHDDLWPSHDPFSVEEFQKSQGLRIPSTPEWNSLAWKKWILWRQQSVNGFLSEVKKAAEKANPNVLVFAENWNVDSPLATGYAQDPVKVGQFLPTAPEVSTIADRADLGEKAMGNATLEQWQAFANMVVFSVSANRGAPTWILTYGAESGDALKTAGVVLAFGGQFYEARGPSMLDDSVREDFRKEFFSWVAKEARLLRQPRKAKVALWYSPNARDFLDKSDAGLYEETTPFFFSYRQAGKTLLKNHVPYRVVFDAKALKDYASAVVPTACLTNEERKALGEIATVLTGETFDESCEKPVEIKSSKTLDDLIGKVLPPHVFYSESESVVFLANVGQEVSVELPARGKARFSSMGIEKTLEPQNGKIKTPIFSGPALVEWVE